MKERRKRKTIISIASGSNNPPPRNTLDIPGKCSGFGLGNFNIWGTVIDDILRIEIRCMKCGRMNCVLDNPTVQK